MPQPQPRAFSLPIGRTLLVAGAAILAYELGGPGRLARRSAGLEEADSAQHVDAAMAAHVPAGATFGEVLTARRFDRLQRARAIAAGSPGGRAGYERAMASSPLVADWVASPDRADGIDADLYRRIALPFLGVGIAREGIAVAPEAPPASATAAPAEPSALPPTAASTSPAEEPSPAPTSAAPAELTYWRDAMPVLRRECVTCHVEGGIAPFSLETHAGAAANADLVRWALAEEIMPPLPASPVTGLPFDDPRIMDPADRAMLIRWLDEGAPEGDPATAPDIPPPAANPYGPPDLAADIGADYTPPEGVRDDYRCFVIDPKLSRDTELTMVDILPQSAEMFHHGILYLALPEDLADVKRLDDAEPGPGWTCFGGPGFDSIDWTAAEAVGAQVRPFPNGTAKQIPARSVFVLQQHYNTLNGHFKDRTKVQFWKAERPVNKPPRDYRLVNPLFYIGAGVKAHTVTAGLDIAGAEGGNVLQPRAKAGRLWRVWGHMHTLGDRFSLDLIRKDGRRTRLLDIPRWDFNWQGAYDLVEPVVVQSGDRVEMTCTWDNSPENQPLVGGVRQAPRAVRWGEGTFDEMCLGGITITD